MLGSTLLLAVTCLLINSAGSQKIRTVACEGSEAQLKCDKGQLISVSIATYGRSDQKTCSSGRPVQQTTNVQCSGNADKLAQSCNGKQSCSIQAANSVFGDPCFGTYKYLEVEYTCESPESSSQEEGHTVACEGSVAQIECDKGQLISVSIATYGRSDQKTCSSGRPVQQTTNVQCSGNADKVAQSCNGKQSCAIQAANSVFGDPCFGTYKYLEVEYTCESPESSSQEEGPTVACEGSVAQIECDKGQLISVSIATYGRSDQKTCSSGRPVQQTTNVQCSGNADKVAQSCNGKQSCSIQAANSVFGDPCVGTYKYLEVEYTCESPESSSQVEGPTVACEGSVARLQCDKGQLISVSRATYGRSDQKTCSSGRPVQQTTNVQCSGNADKVAQRCNGRRRCAVRAGNDVFGDPCVGTYKYLEVDYLCYASVTG
ncbi:rhamnose-binding lectin [Fundulus diaphanus]